MSNEDEPTNDQPAVESEPTPKPRSRRSTPAVTLDAEGILSRQAAHELKVQRFSNGGK